MSQALRKLAGCIAKTNCIVIFINQLREKVGVVYGNPEVTTGGRALKFYSSVRIDVRRIEALKSGSEIIGNRTRAKIVKNKVAPPFRERSSTSCTARASPRPASCWTWGVKLDLVQKSGSWFAMGELRLGQGRDAAKQYLRDNPDPGGGAGAEDPSRTPSSCCPSRGRRPPGPQDGRWTCPPTTLRTARSNPPWSSRP